MLRQRIRTRSPRTGWLGRLPALVLALALVWYGLMCVLLAVGVSPTAVNAISGYRTVFDAVAGAGPLVGPTARAIAAGAGLLAFLVFGYLAVMQIPRPYVARTPVELSSGPDGQVTVEPRAIERVAETAALGHPAIGSPRARYGTDDLTLTVETDRARDLPATLRGVRDRVHAALAEHDLPDLPVNVTLGGFSRRHRRELD
jgi:hypothetical protein